jgi:hypothetical protein
MNLIASVLHVFQARRSEFGEVLHLMRSLLPSMKLELIRALVSAAQGRKVGKGRQVHSEKMETSKN